MNSRIVQSGRISPPCKGGVAAAINKKLRSHRSAADRGRSPRKPDRAQPSTEAVAHRQMFQNAFRNLIRERPPRPRLFRTGPFFDGAAIPPLQGNMPVLIHSELKYRVWALPMALVL